MDGTIGDILASDFFNQTCLIETDQGGEVKVKLTQLEVIERGSEGEDGDWGGDIDLEALKKAEENKIAVEKNLKRKYRAEFVQREIRLYKKRAQVIIQNPPFGTKQPHADKAFLLKAMELAPTIYSIHKIAGERFIATLAEDNGFSIKGIIPIKFPLKPTLTFHRKKTYYTDVGVWMLEKRRRKV